MGHNSAKNVDDATVLFLSHRLMVICISTKFHESILDGIKVIERTQFS